MPRTGAEKGLFAISALAAIVFGAETGIGLYCGARSVLFPSPALSQQAVSSVRPAPAKLKSLAMARDDKPLALPVKLEEPTVPPARLEAPLDLPSRVEEPTVPPARLEAPLDLPSRVEGPTVSPARLEALPVKLEGPTVPPTQHEETLVPLEQLEKPSVKPSFAPIIDAPPKESAAAKDEAPSEIQLSAPDLKPAEERDASLSAAPAPTDAEDSPPAGTFVSSDRAQEDFEIVSTDIQDDGPAIEVLREVIKQGLTVLGQRAGRIPPDSVLKEVIRLRDNPTALNKVRLAWYAAKYKLLDLEDLAENIFQRFAEQVKRENGKTIKTELDFWNCMKKRMEFMLLATGDASSWTPERMKEYLAFEGLIDEES